MDQMQSLFSSNCWCSQVIHKEFPRSSLQPDNGALSCFSRWRNWGLSEEWDLLKVTQDACQSQDWNQVGPHSSPLSCLHLLPGSWISSFVFLSLKVGQTSVASLPSIPQLSMFMSLLMGLCRLAQLPSVSQRATWSCVCHRMFTVHGAETKQHPSCWLVPNTALIHGQTADRVPVLGSELPQLTRQNLAVRRARRKKADVGEITPWAQAALRPVFYPPYSLPRYIRWGGMLQHQGRSEEKMLGTELASEVQICAVCRPWWRLMR